jgi:hypothetical protein
MTGCLPKPNASPPTPPPPSPCCECAYDSKPKALGGHGAGLRKSGLPAAEWPVRVGEWLDSRGWLKE